MSKKEAKSLYVALCALATLPACTGGAAATSATIGSESASTSTSWTESVGEPDGCGDGDVGPGELCDDGNTVDDDGCSNTRTLPGCGGIVPVGDECDDGAAPLAPPDCEHGTRINGGKRGSV